MKLTAIVSVALMLVLSACASSASDADTDAPEELTEVAFRAELVNVAPPSPFADALGLETIDSGLAATLARLHQQEVEVCMRALGWPYVVHVSVWSVGDSWLPSLSREEFAVQHGFGSTLRPEDVTGGLVVSDDPTWPEIEKLSPAEQEAYLLDLYGDSDAGEFGCERTGSSEMFDGRGDMFLAITDTLNEQLRNDDDYRRATKLYQQCTTEKGLPWLDDPWQSRELGRGGVFDQRLSQDQEADAALAELECRYPWARQVRPIQWNIEVTLVEENREFFEQVRALLS